MRDWMRINQLLHDGLQKVQAWLDLLLWVGGLHHGAQCGDINTFSSHIVRVGHDRYVNICMNKPQGDKHGGQKVEKISEKDTK